ncbi:MAG: ABC transporter substrate-binding protein [Oscillospiraceae bacterium]|nr:ABC transporter substrate-binding protein [Oscillospiraceae bacterium]
MKKIFLVPVIILLFLVLVSCNNKKVKPFPVNIGEISIASAPSSVIPLSLSLSNLLIDLDQKNSIVATTNDIKLENIISVGNSINPDLEKIISLKPDLVISNSNLSTKDSNILKSNNINYIYIPIPNRLEELEEYYIKIASIFYGNIEGENIGKEYYNKNIQILDNIKLKLNDKTILPYIYIISDDFIATGDTFQSQILSYLGQNLAKDEKNYDFKFESISPSIIFVSSEAEIDKIKKDNRFKDSSAVKNNKIYSIDSSIIEQRNLISFQLMQNIAKQIYQISFD